MAPQYTRASPRRSPRTPKTSVKLTGSSLHSEANFFLLRPRKIRITKNVRLQNEALERAIEAELRSEKLAIEETTLNAHIIFPNRRPRITKAEQAAQDQPTFESLKVGEPAMSDASGHATCKRGTHDEQSKEPTESDTSGHVQASANNLEASIPIVDRPALEMYLARSTTSHSKHKRKRNMTEEQILDISISGQQMRTETYQETGLFVLGKTEVVQPSDSAYTHEYRSHSEISHEKHSSDSSRDIHEDGRFEGDNGLGEPHIPRAHPDHNPVEDESESWGDYENQDDFLKQFKEEDKSEDELSEPTIKAYQKTPKAITPKGHGKAPKGPVRRRGHFLARNSHKSVPSNVQVESQRYAPSTSGPSVHSSGYWESEAFNAGRHERKPPPRHLSQPNPRAVPSDLRVSDPERDFTLPSTKVQEQKAQETGIWDTIESLLAASSTSPPYAAWSQACDKFFSSTSKSDAPSFPTPGPFIPASSKCTGNKCTRSELLGTCHRELRGLFNKGNGSFGLVWLKRERLKWHPDHFAGQIGRGENKRELREMAGEMFRLVQRSIEGYGER
ncbi:uncharacterized protein RAG0_13309 [Rhynchosporium agropyri]|uniref:Uncharacterized protein n=1 Tax=Rhynchosporium agropyri TaxID=914238 RepID=A0A1E1LC70_9HELO|nr:uncharacterized protein RAG0_13309 [Rhynchosporium agropyri]